MMFEIAHLFFVSAYWTLLSAMVLGATCIVGAVFSSGLSLLWLKPPKSEAAYLAVGLLVVINALWFGFQYGVPGQPILAAVFTLLAIFCVGQCVFGVQSQAIILLSRVCTKKTEILFFLGYLFIVYTLFFWMVADKDIPILTINNNDVFNYALFADFVLSRDRIGERVAEMQLVAQAKTDVFGALSILSICSFLLGQDAIQSTMVPMALACAVLAFSIHLIAREIFKLPQTVCFSLGVFCLQNSLFAYSVLNYFLSQILASAAFVVILYIFMRTALRPGQPLVLTRLTFASILHLSFIIFVYPVAAAPHLVAILLMFFVVILCEGHCSVENCRPCVNYRGLFRFCATRLVIVATAILLGVVIITPQRLHVVYDVLTRFANANVAGWPLELVRPAILAGIFSWPPQEPDYRLLIEASALIVAIGLACFALIQVKLRSERRLVLALPLFLFAAFLLGYLLVAGAYGASYQQWKYAATYVVPFAFSIPTILLGCWRENQHGKFRAIVFAGFFLVVAVQAGVLANRWSAIAAPVEFANLSAIDKLLSVQRVLIDLPSFPERMLAANFIKTKRIDFVGPTYYSKGRVIESLDVDELVLRRLGVDCGPDPSALRLEGGFFVTQSIYPILAEGNTIDFSAADRCLLAEGLGEREPWGRWTIDKEVRILVGVDPASEGSKEIVIRAQPFIVPGKKDSQRIVAMVNGVKLLQKELTESIATEIVLPITRHALRSGRIEVKFLLPDATRPVDVTESPDTRALGLGLLSMRLKAQSRH